MRTAIIAVVLCCGLAVWAYQTPRIKALFAPQVETGDPLEFLKKPIPEQKPRTWRRRDTSSAGDPVESSVSSAPENKAGGASASDAPQVPSRQLSRTLLGILQAQGISGISLTVDDTHIEVFGEVQSSEDRQRVLNTLEKGRGARQLKAEHLIVKNQE